VRAVLHVLPHPGGGGETYVDALARMEGYRSDRLYLAPSPRSKAALRSVPRTGLSVQLAARKYDLLHVHGEVASAVCLPSLRLHPSVVTINGLHLLRRLTGLPRLAAIANVRLILWSASRTICVSEAEYADVVEAGGARAEGRAVMVRNGITPLQPASPEERAGARAALGLAESTLVGAWLGGLDPHKDPLVAVQAAIDVARSGVPVVLLVAGEGPARQELERAAERSGLDAVRMLGYRSEIREVLAAADFFVLSSLREGLSFSLLEAMSIGLPPVVSDAPGNPEAVGEAGIVAPRGDVAAFATAFRRLADDRQARLALGERARARVALDFHGDEMVRLTHEIYDEVASHGRRR
jgi:glycosyltransferase involved in cell wall biosynthesis